MTVLPLTLRLTAFDPLYASVVAGWVPDAASLHWLAPASDPPLTAAKVRAWHKEGVHPHLGWLANQDLPVGYGEINFMPSARHQMWLGHIVVDPAYRGLGLGKCLVAGLLDSAFERYGARNVCLVVFPENVAAVRCYEAVGMQQVGPERWRHPRTGEVYLLIRMEIGRKKYRALRSRQRPMTE